MTATVSGVILGQVELQIGSCFAGDFIVVEQIGRGGFGAVYLVRQTSTGYQRALKVMSPELLTNPHTKKVFEREVGNAANVASDHVLKVLLAGVDTETGCPYLLMERHEGRTLEDIVETDGALSLPMVKQLALELAHGVGALHSAAVIHRDLKPDNLMYVKSRRVGEAHVWMVIDLGISVPIEGGRSGFKITGTLGNPRFMSPEQCQEGEVVRPSSDVWSLGLVAFFALTGQHYWCGRAPLTVLHEICVAPLVLASERAGQQGFAGTLPAGFDAWFAKCVNRDREARYPDAEACAHALAALLDQAIADAQTQLERDAREPDARSERVHEAPPATPRAAGLSPVWLLGFLLFVTCAWGIDVIRQNATTSVFDAVASWLGLQAAPPASDDVPPKEGGAPTSSPPSGGSSGTFWLGREH